MRSGFKDVRAEMRSGFKKANERLGRVEIRLDKMDNRLGLMENKLTRMEMSLRKIERHFDI